ncbi:cell wall hydrolase/autolysin [Russula earlei]|uniref:Cell wall hydrolase/autolysin n=1 Tax=Russula earlei TaxID=71964 RepID=A0ACC0TRF8_9AGAM|nr:cell wall hydrolase/autolysin [Russula earlei]
MLVVLQSIAQDSTRHTWWLARSTGKYPTLAYGLGDDRLGGAKLGYIDTNIVLKIIDSTKSMYQVQLSKAHTAYINKEFVKTDSLPKPRPFYLTNSWSVKGTDSCYDILTINMDERLPYKSWMEINPSKIMLDLYGVQSNTNWITQLQTLKEIKNVYYNQVEDDVVRVTIELKHQQHWGYSIGYKNRSLVIKVKRQPDLVNIKKLKIAIDAGHGGTNAGADGLHSKVLEKEYTLLFAKAFQKYLKGLGFTHVIMTRTIDTTLTMPERIAFLQEKNPDLLISFHLNSSDNPEIQGSSTYYKHIGFRPLTQAVLQRMLEIKMAEYGNVGNFNFSLNAPTDFVNCLLEIAFLSNTEDEKKILSASYRQSVARQVYKGINDWLLQCRK